MEDQIINTKPIIFYINGQFLVFDHEDAMKLRRHRVLGRLIGCPHKNPHQLVTGGLPCLFSHFSANIANELDLAVFKRLIHKKTSDPDANKTIYERNISELSEKAKSDLIRKRTEELAKRDLEITSGRLGQFEVDKLKWPLSDMLSTECSSLQDELIDKIILLRLFQFDNHKMVVFRDLYKRGLYISSGMKFGGDFLVYLGEPVRYHAQFTVRVVASDRDGCIDLKKSNLNELNALHRVSHTSNKITLFATTSGSPTTVKYYRLKEREYLSAESNNDSFESIELALANLRLLSNVAFGPIEYKTDDEMLSNKMMKS